MRSNHIAMSLVIKAPIEKVWAALADWESQGDWMLQTRVDVTSEIREGVGTTIAAFTGIGWKVSATHNIKMGKNLGFLIWFKVTYGPNQYPI